VSHQTSKEKRERRNNRRDYENYPSANIKERGDKNEPKTKDNNS